MYDDTYECINQSYRWQFTLFDYPETFNMPTTACFITFCPTKDSLHDPFHKKHKMMDIAKILLKFKIFEEMLESKKMMRGYVNVTLRLTE